MRQFWLRLLSVTCLYLLVSGKLYSQNFSFNCARDTIVQDCAPSLCMTLLSKIPDIHGSSASYSINPATNILGCMPANTNPANGTSTGLTIDDRYSAPINIGFTFPFYGTNYTQLLASTNGIVCFDFANANSFSHYGILRSGGGLTATGGTPEDLPSSLYDRALIMGPYHDIYPNATMFPTYTTVGVAPHRKWILNFNRIRLFSCTSLIENTHQIILHESTGIIEVFVYSKDICTAWNQGRAMIGLQNFNRDQAIMVNGRKASDAPWGSLGMNESWRFVPNSGPSLLRRVELTDLSGTIISTGTTSPVSTGVLEASFPNVCVTSAATTFIVRSVYEKFDDPSVEVFGFDTVQVIRNSALTANATSNATSCNGASNGSVTVTASNGTAPYTWAIDGSPGSSGPSPYTFTNLSSGSHSVAVTDATGCTRTILVDVTAGANLATTATKTDALCNGTATGTITVTQPSIGAAPFQYSLDGLTWQASNVFSGLAAGTYTVYIRSAEGCPGQLTMDITEPATLTASSSNANGTCNGGANGTITISASGGTTAYQYSIDGTTFQSSNVFNVVPGNYTVTVKDQNGCIRTFTTTVALTNDLTFTPQTDPTICEGSSTQLDLVSNALQYNWTPATGLSSTTIHDPVANPVVTTQYIVTATRGVCTIDDTVIVNVNAAPIPNAGPDGFICYGQTYQLQGSGGTQYSWSPNTYLSSTTIPDPIVNPLRTITYTLSILSDANGCSSLTTDDMVLDVTAPIKVKTYPYDSIGYPGELFNLLAVPSDSDVINYTWTPTRGLSNPNIANPVATVGAIGDDVIYQVIASTIAGCKGEGYVRVRVYKGPDIYVPTGFTPNGDGKNDKFFPFPVGIREIKYFRVFNRWGQLIFSTNQLHDGWDGTYLGKEQQAGVYVWMAQAITKDNKVITKQGTIALIR